MRDYAELSKSVHCCVGCEESQCEICPRGDTPFSYIECKTKLADDATDAIEELLAAVPKWISVKERLPEENKNYLCYGVFLPLGVKAMDMYRFDGVRWRTSSDVEITHWMPLPVPPKEET